MIRRPDIQLDHGFLDDGKGNIDNSKRREPTMADRISKLNWLAKLEAAEILRPDLVDATRAYRHFLMGDGQATEFSYESYSANDRAGAQTVDSAIEDTSAAALELSDMLHKSEFVMQTDPIGVGGDNGRYPYPGTENWQKAIGAHVIWLEAHVQVVEKEGRRRFTVKMTLHAEDRYNFNPGAKDIATGTPDAENGRFEITGLGHEFLNTSTLRRQIEFSADKAPLHNYRERRIDQHVTKLR